MDPIIEFDGRWLDTDTLYEVRVECERQSANQLAARIEIERRHALESDGNYTPRFTLNELLDVGMTLLRAQSEGSEPSGRSEEVVEFGELVQDVLETTEETESLNSTYIREVYAGVTGDAQVSI